MSRKMLFRPLLSVGGLAALLIGIVLTSPDASAALPFEECIQCDTNGCTSAPPGYLEVGHKDTEGPFEDWALRGEFHSGCVYNETGDTCDPHELCDNGEEELLLALVSALEEGDAKAVKELLDRSNTLRFNAERLSIQGVGCDGLSVVRNLPVSDGVAGYLIASQN